MAQRKRTGLLCLLALLSLAASLARAQDRALFREGFRDLTHWMPVEFPSIQAHTTYTLGSAGDEHYLRAESHGSASALVHEKDFDVYAYPHIRWRWKVENTYQKDDEKAKAGDDYPARVYVMFWRKPEEMRFWQKAAERSARLLGGGSLPASSLDYVWASREPVGEIFTSPYADNVKMVVLESGGSKEGEWVTEEVDALRDYEKAFGTRPPALARIGIMNDSDNTGQSSVSYFSSLEVYAK